MAENVEQQAGGAGEHTGERAGGYEGERAGGRPGGYAGDQVGDQARDQGEGRAADRARERRVGDAATLKALADPLRLGILGALMGADGGSLTAKEIASALGEPQTKLYRHIKQLETVGLIRVAGTRLVSGIVESRYAAAQESLRLSSEIFSADSPDRSEAYGAVLAGVDRVRGDFQAQAQAGRVDFSAPKDGSAGPPSMFADFSLRLSPARLVRLRSQLGEIFDELMAEGRSEAKDAVDVTVLTLLYGLQPEHSSRADSPTGTES
ncbi:helix-turn-helix transcriptional regulator [Kitasatospora sp. RG8]|uniref:winged helix-turn-helix domain-containing protein n=1 Tax=Kitasatospora sp. RG8 TaxID=2820815 RepID=UPI001ADF1213|nr:helix-turn-helix domain-containing protein [Kitasatospora sp. RG8]MBP0452386.1 helix-turn-helix transcriptional regulator [Kitasatospora sp. RG8]